MDDLYDSVILICTRSNDGSRFIRPRSRLTWQSQSESPFGTVWLLDYISLQGSGPLWGEEKTLRGEILRLYANAKKVVGA